MRTTNQRDIYPMIRSADDSNNYKQPEPVSPTSNPIDLINKGRNRRFISPQDKQNFKKPRSFHNL